MKLSIIIPTLNEASNIEILLKRLKEITGIHEILVSDGGSSDGTPELVHTPARLVKSEPGRGIQLRSGAEAATGDVLLFLHADVEPPRDLAAQVSGALASGYIGGNFRLRYPDGGLLGRILQAANRVYRRLGRYYGDSGLFVLREAHDAFGGFPHIPIMEDIVFVRRMERYGPTAYLAGPMVSSARRWKGRAARTLLLWWFMQITYSLGASPWTLARFYRNARRK